MYISNIFKIKEGKLDQVKAWAVALNGERRIEAIVNYVYEDISREMLVIFKGKDKNYYALDLNETKARSQYRDQDVPINRDHTALKKECFEAISEKGEVMLDFKL